MCDVMSFVCHSNYSCGPSVAHSHSAISYLMAMNTDCCWLAEWKITRSQALTKAFSASVESPKELCPN